MVPVQHTEEVLSVSYVTAVVSHFGHTFSTLSQDYGTDGIVRRIRRFENQVIDLGPVFDCQLKATIDWELVDGKIAYDLKAEAYNRLVLRNEHSDVPILLILMCLPKSKDDWLVISSESLQLRNCCYFHYLSGPTTTNTVSKRVFVSARNLFDATNLSRLFEDFEDAVRDA